jgi:hypothetical protein
MLVSGPLFNFFPLFEAFFQGILKKKIILVKLGHTIIFKILNLILAAQKCFCAAVWTPLSTKFLDFPKFQSQ